MPFFSRSIRVILVVALTIIFVGGPLLTSTFAQGPSIVGKAGVLIDSRSGQVLYEKNADVQLPPASTTKVLTVAVALDAGNLDDKVTISKNAASQEGSSIYLKEGEVLTLEELLWGVLLKSGNDAAVAVAEHISGSVPAFTKLMNDKAKEWGATNSNFNNPNGLPDELHYTTARDFALISKHAMEMPLFREMSATKVKEINRTNPVNRLINHNKLLWRYEGANGIKTGYTRVAQQCLVSSAQREGQEFIAVVFGSTGNNIWTDSTALLDYGFNNFHTRRLASGNKFVQAVPVANGQKEARALLEKDLYYTSAIEDQARPKEEIKIFKGLAAPIRKGQKLGYLIYNVGGKEVARAYLIADKDVAEKVIIKRHPWMLPVIGIILTMGIAATINRKRIKRRRRGRWISSYRGPIR